MEPEMQTQQAKVMLKPKPEQLLEPYGTDYNSGIIGKETRTETEAGIIDGELVKSVHPPPEWSKLAWCKAGVYQPLQVE